MARNPLEKTISGKRMCYGPTPQGTFASEPDNCQRPENKLEIAARSNLQWHLTQRNIGNVA